MDLPVDPGGGGGGGGTRPDAAVAVIDAPTASDAMPSLIDAALINGRVCLAADPRKLNACASTGAGGLTVRLGSNVTTTNVDGTFTIAAASGTWRVTGSNIVTSIMALADYEIPALARTTFDAMLATNNVVMNPGEGSVMLQVIRNGAGLAGAIAAPNPAAAWMPFYDNAASQADWNQGTGGTGADGTIWVAGFDVGTASIAVTPLQGAAATESGLQIVDGAITFATVIFP